MESAPGMHNNVQGLAWSILEPTGPSFRLCPINGFLRALFCLIQTILLWTEWPIFSLRNLDGIRPWGVVQPQEICTIGYMVLLPLTGGTSTNVSKLNSNVYSYVTLNFLLSIDQIYYSPQRQLSNNDQLDLYDPQGSTGVR